MDVLASRLARDAKAKSKMKKGIKRLSKNDTKENKKKTVSKVDSVAVEKSSKKQKNLPKEISSKKKKLIKDALIEKQESQIKNLTKKKVKDAIVSLQNKVPKPKKVVKGDTDSSNKKKQANSLKKLKTQIVKSDAEVKTQVIMSKKRKAPLQVKEDVSNFKATKKIKSQPTKPVVAANNVTPSETKNLGNSKKLKKIKSQITKSSVAKNSKEIVKTIKNLSNAKSLKKVKSEPIKSVVIDNNEEIKNIKSKKRKQAEVEEGTSGPNLKKKEVINFVKALIKVIETEQEKKNNLFDSEKPPIFLSVNCFKVPKVPLHQHRITLPHSMISPTDDIAIFVKDLKRGRRRDPEDTIRHYEDIFQQHGITQIKAIIPINQVKTDYRQFEMRRRLFNSYDYFLVDGRISGHIAHLLGKHFREKRKLPTSVQMERKNLKEGIDSALQKTCLQIHGNGDNSIVQIGTCSMKVDHIANNILAVIEDLSKNFPGGWENVRSLRIKTPLSLAIPIYISLKNKNNVEVPVVTPKRPKAYEEVEGELSTFTSNIKVHVLPDGTVSIVKVEDESDEDTKDNIKKIDVKEETKENVNQDIASEDEDEEEEDEDDED